MSIDSMLITLYVVLLSTMLIQKTSRPQGRCCMQNKLQRNAAQLAATKKAALCK